MFCNAFPPKTSSEARCNQAVACLNDFGLDGVRTGQAVRATSCVVHVLRCEVSDTSYFIWPLGKNGGQGLVLLVL